MTTETTTQSQEKSAEYKFAQLRKQLENERYAREQAEARAKQYEEERKEWQSSKMKEPEEDKYDDPYIDEKRLEKRFKSWEASQSERIDKIAEAKAKAILEQERQANFLNESRDFDKIMSPEMLQKFVDTYPDIADGILKNMPDDFNRQKHVYKTIKSLKLHLKPEEKEDVNQQIAKNQKSGLYQPSGISPSPYKAAGDFSREGQKQAHEQMEALAARFGGGKGRRV
jgi:hypothetical protein